MIFFSGYTVNYGAKSRSCVRLVFELQYSKGKCRTKNLIFLTRMNRSSQFCRVYPVQVNLVIKKHRIAEKNRKWNPLTDAFLSSLKPVFWSDEPQDKTASMPWGRNTQNDLTQHNKRLQTSSTNAARVIFTVIESQRHMGYKDVITKGYRLLDFNINSCKRLIVNFLGNWIQVPVFKLCWKAFNVS